MYYIRECEFKTRYRFVSNWHEILKYTDKNINPNKKSSILWKWREKYVYDGMILAVKVKPSEKTTIINLEYLCAE